MLYQLETYRFYTASLLVAYDGDCVLQKSSKPNAKVIDFAHSTHQGFRGQFVHEGPDMDFTRGLQSFVRILEQLMQKRNHGQEK